MAYLVSQDQPINLFDAVKGYKMRPDFTKPLTSIADAKSFIEALHSADLMFHFEDSPETIGNMVDGAWVDTFTKSEAKHLRFRVAELYSFDWSEVSEECPIGYALTIMDAWAK